MGRALRSWTGPWKICEIAVLCVLGATLTLIPRAHSASGQFAASVPVTVTDKDGDLNMRMDVVMGAMGIVAYGTNVSGQPYLPNANSCADIDTSLIPTTATTPIFIVDENIGDCPSVVRVLNAVEAGAAGVIIIAADVVGVVAANLTVNPFSGAYFQDRIRVPVGMVSSQQGSALQQAIANVEDSDAMTLTFGFTEALPAANEVEAELWFYTDDACGYPCDNTRKFLSDMADIAVNVGTSDAVTLSSHWLLRAGCKTNDPNDCKKHCIASGRYCYYSSDAGEESVETSDDSRDAAVAEETVRRICLWSALNKRGLQQDFWKYIRHFVDNCKSSSGDFNSGCSDSSFDAMDSELERSDWEDCLKGLDGTTAINEVETEIALAQTSSTTAAISTNLRWGVRINKEHFRGAPHANMVVRAACAVVPPATAGLCSSLGSLQGVCAYSDAANQPCLSADNKAAHKTNCYTSSGGATCGCEVGYELKDGICQDVNECSSLGNDLCPYDDTRNVCVNTDGGYMCSEYQNVCDTDSKGNCWQSADRTVTSCKDNLSGLRDAAKKSTEQSLSGVKPYTCDCGAVGGGDCYKTVVENGVSQCKKVRCVRVGAIVGGVFGAVGIVLLTAVGAVWFVKRRRAQSGGLSGSSNGDRYGKFEDGSDVEMGKQEPNPVNAGDLRIALEKVEMDHQ